MKIDWKKISIKDLAALICKKLKDEDIDAVLVGGACVSIYTKNKYVSYDLDFVSHTSLKEISRNEGHAEKYGIFIETLRKK